MQPSELGVQDAFVDQARKHTVRARRRGSTGRAQEDHRRTHRDRHTRQSQPPGPGRVQRHTGQRRVAPRRPLARRNQHDETEREARRDQQAERRHEPRRALKVLNARRLDVQSDVRQRVGTAERRQRVTEGRGQHQGGEQCRRPCVDRQHEPARKLGQR